MRTRAGTTRHNLLVGKTGSEEITLSPRDRATHVMIAGAPDSGKTTLLEHLIRQDIRLGHGLCLIDPQGPLGDRVIAYTSSRQVPLVVLDASADRIAGFNPFHRNGDDLVTQVERRVQAVMKVWGSRSGDDTPRLEKWLRVLFTVILHYDLTILEALLLLNQPGLRARLLYGLPYAPIRQLLYDLSVSSAREYQTQIESTVNRLLRFDAESTAGMVLGLGTNSIEIPRLMDEGGVLVVKLPLGPHLSDIQQRTIGILLVNEFYEGAMRRKRGARPFYLYLDEAGLFATPELGKTLDHCRQKGLHVTFAFQHPWQFKREDYALYKSVSNSALTKIVFRLPDREDATEMADNIFPGLAEPEVKDEIYGLSHRLKDTYLPVVNFGISGAATFGKTVSSGRTRGRSHARTTGAADASGFSIGTSGAKDVDIATGGFSWSSSEHHGESEFESDGHALKADFSSGYTLGLGLQPATLHEPFQELKSRTFVTLEERRWKAAERIMRQRTGHCFVRLKTGELKEVVIPRPRPLPYSEETLRFRKQIYQALVPREEARRLIHERQANLLNGAAETYAAPGKRPRRQR